MEHQFRNAALGGFNKQDVLDYLELVARENREQLQSAQNELEQAREQYRTLAEQESALKAQLAQLTQEKTSLIQATAKAQSELEQAQQHSAALQAKLDESTAQRNQLLEQVEKLRPDAEAYTAVKERSAGVELDAHRRAQGVLDEAKAEAQQLRGQVQHWMSKVEEEYRALRGQIDAAMSGAAEELGRVENALGQISQCLSEQDGAFVQMEKAYGQYPLAKEKVPAPLPLIEEES